MRNIYRSTGVGRVARELTEHLAVLPDVHLQVLADPLDYSRIVEKVGKPWTNYTYCFMQHETSRQQALWFLLNKPSAESYWPDAQIVHCTAESYIPVRRARLAVSCHDAQHFEPGVHKNSVWLWKQRLKWKLLFDRLAKKADIFHMISEYSAERTAHFFPAIKDRMCVVHNAASDSFFAPPSDVGKQILDRLGLAGRRYILVPGGLHHRKNADLILEAWPLLHQMHPDVLLVVINHSNPHYQSRAEALGDSVVIGGFQEEEQLVALYNSSTIVWFPTRYDGFGMPVIEAMACGAPVVSSNTTGIPEVAGNAALLISPERTREHVDTISGLLEDEKLQETLRSKGRERAQHYTWRNSALQLQRHFVSVL